ncbi:MAG: phytanoyl-CoA dioxygenase family protein [Candidatus Poribacteria bacterium]|nr:phytanoyl-CoA dioxygenase family protein [Candidatus Poribacteria bacterium]MDE0502929.1 phytanoyl-CoA dioxygenase family protein [Candidatus Poribacteria bacterium]
MSSLIFGAQLPQHFGSGDLKLDRFRVICDQTADLESYRFAESVEQNIVIYLGDTLRKGIVDSGSESDLKAELGSCLRDGPGIFVIRGAFQDTAVIDDMTAIFIKIVSDEKSLLGEVGDHFGDNERIWNSFQKACLVAPELFIEYYGNPLLALAAQAWLGPYYQITAQVNNVKPGGQAQSPHRDYHLGFQSAKTAAEFPAHAHLMSQFLTLQGSVAHTDMPIESGPTLFLPFSQQFPAGYLAFHEEDFAAVFEEQKSQVPFEKGDVVFLSPALFHAAGTNLSQDDRIANLLQISSAFGRPMESINRQAMMERVYPILLDRSKRGTISSQAVQDTIAAVADGYSFPTNLDSDPPIGGNVPFTAQQLMHQALKEHWPPQRLREALIRYANKREARGLFTVMGRRYPSH